MLASVPAIGQDCSHLIDAVVYFSGAALLMLCMNPSHDALTAAPRRPKA